MGSWGLSPAASRRYVVKRPRQADTLAFDNLQSHVSSSPAPRAPSLTHSFSSSSFGSSAHPRSSVPPSTSRGTSGNKRRKLQFSSELGPPRNRFNADGSENVDWARYQSALALKRKWEAIYDKFKDAHLAPQDEIFLGGRGKGDLRVCRDRGVLRALQDEVQFGHFIEEDEYKQQQEQQQQLEEGEEGYDLANSDEDELGGWGNKSYLKSQYPEFNSENNDWDAGTARQGVRRGQEGLEEEEEEEEEEAPLDPELLEFLEAERQRREIMGPESVASEAEADGSDDDDDDDVVDFSDPLWDLPRHRREQARRRQQRLQRMRSTRWYSEESSSDDASSVIDVDAYDEAQGEEDAYSAEEDAEQQQEEEEEDGFAYHSLDEMDLFNDDPDLSAYDPTAIEDLIRRENATLAAQGKMLVPEEQVADLAMALTRGGPGMADEYHALSSQPPSSSDTLVNPAYSVLAPGKEAGECLDAAWTTKKDGAEVAYTRSCRRSTSPLFLGISSPGKAYGDDRQRPTPPRSVMSDASSDATKVGSEVDMPISSPAPGRFYSRREQRSQSRGSLPPTHAHMQGSEEEHGSYQHAEQHAMETSSAIGLDTPMRQRQQLNQHQVQLEEEEEEEDYAYEAQQEQEEEEEEEAQEPAPLPWLPSFVGVQVRKPKRRGRMPGSKNKPRPTLEQLEMDIEVIDDDDEEEVESAEEAAPEPEPRWERDPTPEPKWRARKRIIRDDSDEDEVEPHRAPVAAVASSEEGAQLEDAWRAPKKQRRSKDGGTSSATNAQQSVTPACGGPTTCIKTFCMSCGAARSSALLL